MVSLAGCGNWDPAAHAGLTLNGYRTDADQICAHGNLQITALPANSVMTRSGIAHIEAIAANVLTRLKTITPPAAIRVDVEIMLDTYERALTYTKQAFRAYQGSDLSRARTLLGLAASQSMETDTEAHELSLRSCATDPKPSGPISQTA